MRRSFVASACLGFLRTESSEIWLDPQVNMLFGKPFSWQEAKAYFNGLSARPLNECDVLDFGCGWGRYTRLFLKDTPPDRIVGVDVDPEFVALSAQLLSGVKFSSSRRFLQPTFLRTTLISSTRTVFSHLPVCPPSLDS